MTMTPGFLDLIEAAGAEGFSTEDFTAHLVWAHQLAQANRDQEAAEFLRELTGSGSLPRMDGATLEQLAGTRVVGIHLGERSPRPSSIVGRQHRGIAPSEIGQLRTMVMRSCAEWRLALTRPTVVIFRAGRPILIYFGATWQAVSAGGRKYIASAEAVDVATGDTCKLAIVPGPNGLTPSLTMIPADSAREPLLEYLRGHRRVRGVARQPIDSLSSM
ncbi:hypothetical protein [Microbacterium xylanilyticum]